ncbi:MAG: hypothetical protein GF388_01805 [Candidatus Aegiribacteria sp.]|nr:hypothetical protein [Candidatus Aegiribacteria sp.]
MSSDPQFVNAANSNFKLSANSPCINAGDATSAPATDYNGDSRPAGSADDIGAYEFAAGGTVISAGTTESEIYEDTEVLVEGGTVVNCTFVNTPVACLEGNSTIQYSIFEYPSETDLHVGTGVTVTGGYNYLDDASVSADGTYNGSADDSYEWSAKWTSKYRPLDRDMYKEFTPHGSLGATDVYGKTWGSKVNAGAVRMNSSGSNFLFLIEELK